MLEPIFKAIENLVSDFTRRRLVVYLSTLILVLSAAWFIEYHTHFFELTKLDSITNLLVSLNELENSGEDTSQVALNITARLEELTAIAKTTDEVSRPDWRLSQAAAASAPWILFLLSYLSTLDKSKEPDWMDGVLGALVFAGFAAAIGFGIDPSRSGLYRYGVPQLPNLLIFLLFFFIGMDGKRTHNNQNQADA